MNAINNYVRRRLSDPSEHGRDKAEHYLWREIQAVTTYTWVAGEWFGFQAVAEEAYSNALALEHLLANTLVELPTPPRLALFSTLNPDQYHYILDGTIIALDEHGQKVTFTEEQEV